MTTLSDLGEVISTDVLVIGAGGSGLCAAITAKEHPVDVLLVEKGTAGYGGQIPGSGGHFAAVRRDADLDKVAQWFIREGFYLNDQDWVFSFLQDLYSSIQELADWGIPITKDEKGQIDIVDTENYYVPYLYTFYHAPRFLPSLRARARKSGAKILNKIQVLDLLKQDGRIVGAVGFNVIDGRFYVFKAKATILANGSCDFQVFRLAASCTGEGVAAAYRAGAEMTSAELSAVYAPVTKMTDRHMRGIDCNYFFNALGENISERYQPAPREAWFYLVRGMVKEFNEGRAPIYLDLTAIPKEVRDFIAYQQRGKPPVYILWEGQPTLLAHAVFKQSAEILSKEAEKLELIPKYLGKLSPIRVDLECKATIPGLWAVGDTSLQAAGIVGAQACTATAPGVNMSYAVLSGLRAGRDAGSFASQTALGEVNEEEVKQLKEEIFAPSQRQGGLLPADAIYEIQKVIAPVKYNFFKSKDRLEEALTIIENLQAKLPELWAKDTHALARCHEATSMAVGAEMIVRAGLMRTETRGCHIREDYPECDDQNWLKWIVIKKDEDRMALSTEDVPIEKYKFKP